MTNKSNRARKLRLVTDSDAKKEPPQKIGGRNAGRELPGQEIRVPEPVGVDPNDDSLRAFAERHYAWCHMTNFSEVSIKLKRATLDRFFDWCEARGIEKLGEVTPGVIEGYQRNVFERRHHKTGKPLAVRSQIQLLECVRTLFKWLTRKKYLASNPATVIDMPRMPFRLPRAVYSVDEIEKILAVIDTTTLSGLRDRTIFEVFYSTGMRRIELWRLKVRDLDFASGLVRIIGKGDKERIVPVGERALHWVTKYLDEARPMLLGAELDPEFLFLTMNGTQIARDTLTALTGKRIKDAKIGKPGACHAFRHSFATHLLEADTDVRLIQEMLGHALIETTTLYTHVAKKKLKDVHTAKHPAAKMPKVPTLLPKKKDTQKP